MRNSYAGRWCFQKCWCWFWCFCHFRSLWWTTTLVWDWTRTYVWISTMPERRSQRSSTPASIIKVFIQLLPDYKRFLLLQSSPKTVFNSKWNINLSCPAVYVKVGLRKCIGRRMCKVRHILQKLSNNLDPVYYFATDWFDLVNYNAYILNKIKHLR